MKPDTQERPDFEKAAEEYAESFKTGEWFETIRKEAFLKGADHSRKRIEELEALLLQETGKCMKYTQEIEDLKKRLQNRHICL